MSLTVRLMSQTGSKDGSSDPHFYISFRMRS